MVRNWAEQINSNDSIPKLLIQKDLNKLQLMAYVGIFQDSNNNNELNLLTDSLVYTLDLIKLDSAFNPHLYASYMDTPTLSNEILQLPKNTVWVSYGEYFAQQKYRGTSNLPATFVEYPINNNQIMGVWLITDYDLALDIYWPAIIVPIAIVILLTVLFWIISSFLYPIKLIRKHVINLKKGNLSSLIPIQGTDELGQLSRSINKMTKDIDRLVSQKQNLLIDVSHELKTPLTRLKFVLANMEMEGADKDSINKEINYLQDMISNMLLSDKLSTPYVEDLEKGRIKIKNLIDDACGMFYEIEKRVKIITQIPDYEINVDKYKLSLAIKNLIDNAIKYGGKKKLIELSVVLKQQVLQIIVEDFGSGIPKNKLKEITKPLYRGRVAKEQSKSGFGLGLAITKKIVEAHSGQLIIESEVGCGTKFIVSLPINRK